VGVTQTRRKPTRVRPSIEDALVQIKAHKGFLTPAALALRVSRGALDRMVSRSSRLSYACHQERGGLTDFAEQQLFRKIQEGNVQAICFALSSRWGQARGYAPKGTEVNLGDTTTVMIGSVTVNAVPSGTFVGGPESTIEHESLTGGIVDDVVTKKLN
jgi:hypothetical protein